MKNLILFIALISFSVSAFAQKSTGIKFAQRTINVYVKQTVTDTANYSIIEDNENTRQLIVMVWVGGTNPQSFDMIVWNGADYVNIEDRAKNQLSAAVKAKILAR